MFDHPAYQRLFAEFKRRHVFRVMAVYGVVGFVILQVVDLVELTSDPEEAGVRAVWFHVLADPMFDPLRNDPRYDELNERFGL